jgi:ParB-like chromosome segregation protein Spo0J
MAEGDGQVTSLQLNHEYGRRGDDDPSVTVSLAALRAGPTFRTPELQDDHVRVLAELNGRWPPIIVARDGFWVIDGRHRAAAAKRSGMTEVRALLFEGSREDAYLKFLESNMRHGLPLSLVERERAGSTLLVTHPDWSDRRIAELCALSPGTVGRLRAHFPARPDCPTGEIEQLDARRGRDGRLRPVNLAARRAQVAEALKARPEASLREIASAVGVSPDTVRRIRSAAQSADAPLSDNAVGAKGDRCLPPPEWFARGATGATAWLEDPAFASRSDSVSLTKWLETVSIDRDWQGYINAVPLGRIYEIADVARQQAKLWSSFADALEARARPRRTVGGPARDNLAEGPWLAT